jgi:hypothetical protein
LLTIVSMLLLVGVQLLIPWMCGCWSARSPTQTSQRRH